MVPLDWLDWALRRHRGECWTEHWTPLGRLDEARRSQPPAIGLVCDKTSVFEVLEDVVYRRLSDLRDIDDRARSHTGSVVDSMDRGQHLELSGR